MLTHTEHKTTITEYSFLEVKKHTSGKVRYNPKKYIHCISILSDLIKKYRFEVLGTSDGYKMILRGGNFYSIETTGVLAAPKTIQADVIYNKLSTLIEKD